MHSPVAKYQFNREGTKSLLQVPSVFHDLKVLHSTHPKKTDIVVLPDELCTVRVSLNHARKYICTGQHANLGCTTGLSYDRS
jgi:hypothetical protein